MFEVLCISSLFLLLWRTRRKKQESSVSCQRNVFFPDFLAANFDKVDLECLIITLINLKNLRRKNVVKTPQILTKLILDIFQFSRLSWRICVELVLNESTCFSNRSCTMTMLSTFWFSCVEAFNNWIKCLQEF